MTSAPVEDLRTLLDAPSPGVLTTTRAEGTALASPVRFRWTGLAFEIVIAGGDVELSHLMQDPRCGHVIFETSAPFRGVAVNGEAVLKDGEVTEIRSPIAGRYLGQEAGRRCAIERGSSPGVLVRLFPERLIRWGPCEPKYVKSPDRGAPCAHPR